jgi:hypothetical protein
VLYVHGFTSLIAAILNLTECVLTVKELRRIFVFPSVLGLCGLDVADDLLHDRGFSEG